MDILLALAEISVAVVGFSAIIIVFKENAHQVWNRHMFSGLIAHIVVALVACFLPFLIKAFNTPVNQLWQWPSLILGSGTIVQVVMIMIVDRKSKFTLKLYTLISGLCVGIIGILNGLDIYFHITLEAYIIGILWHIFQAVLIFAFIMLETEKNT